jgi:acyl-homoserine lactone acylase PvdQ
MFSSGRLPVRHPQVDMGLPTNGTGKYEWRGFMTEDQHPHGVEPNDGVITNWNNKQAAGWQAADDNWSYGSIHREQLLHDAVDRVQTHTLGSVVAAMNRAATQDLRAAKVMRGISAVLDGTAAPSPRDQQMLDLIEQWRASGSSRLDRDNDGKIDDPGAAIMDKAWNRIADAVMSPVLGPQLGELASLIGRDDAPNNQGSSYISGWYGYVDKDLRTLLGDRVRGRLSRRYCGRGSRIRCRAILLSTLRAAAGEVRARLGPDPAAWRLPVHCRVRSAPQECDQIQPFTAGAVSTPPLVWQNRPTFQQAVEIAGHGPR